MTAVVDAINNVAKAYQDLAQVLIATNTTSTPAAAPEQVEEPKAEKKELKKTEEKQATVTIEQVRAVMAEKSQAGLTGKVKELLDSFGATKLSAVKPEDYAALMEAAKELK